MIVSVWQILLVIGMAVVPTIIALILRFRSYKRVTIWLFVPLMIVLFTVLSCLVLFSSKVYFINNKGQYRLDIAIGNTTVVAPDGQKIQAAYSIPRRDYVINCSNQEIIFFSKPYGEAVDDTTRLPDLIHILPHDYLRTNRMVDVFPCEKIPRWIEMSGNEHGRVLNLLQFRDSLIMPGEEEEP